MQVDVHCKTAAPLSRTRPATRGDGPSVAVVAASAAIVGGQSVQAQTLIDHLSADGSRVGFVAIDPPFLTGLRWLRNMRYVRTIINEVHYLSTLRALTQYDVTHVFSAAYWSFLLAAAPAVAFAKASGKRVVLNYHSGEADDHLSRWGMSVRPWLQLADIIVVPSNYLANVFAKYGYTATVVPNVVDLWRFRYRERRHLRPRLLSNRNLEPHYAVDNTLAAFALIKRRHPHAQLTVAGAGSEARRLRRMAEQLCGYGVCFVGQVEPAHMPRLYEQADIFLNSSLIDNQPLSVLEAFAAGLPVVSTPTGDIANMTCGGDAGVLVPSGNPEAMACAVTNLIENPQYALRLSQRAHRELARFSWTRVREGWAAVYGGLLS